MKKLFIKPAEHWWFDGTEDKSWQFFSEGGVETVKTLKVSLQHDKSVILYAGQWQLTKAMIVSYPVRGRVIDMKELNTRKLNKL